MTLEQVAPAPAGSEPMITGSIDGENSFDAIVLGAGMSGLVSASVLHEQGAERVLIVDEYREVGGNHIDREIDGYTFDLGSLIFQDDSPLVDRFPELLPSYVAIDPSWSRLNPQGIVTEYPFSMNDDIIAAGPFEWIRMAASLAWSRLRYRHHDNARDFAFYWVGARLAHRSGLEHYMERFCGVPAEQVDLAFARSRMMWIAEHARVGKQLGALRRKLRRTPPTTPQRRNTQLVRPRSGFADLYAPVVARLENEGAQFRLGLTLNAVVRGPDGFTLRTSTGDVTAPRIVSTIPIDSMLRLTGASAEELPTVTLITLFYSFTGERGFTEPILYNFSRGGAWKRLTVHSDFYGTHREREFFAVEVVAGAGVTTVEAAATEFRAHTTENGLFAGDLQLEGGNILENTYPVFAHGSDQRAAAAIARLREFGITSLGKQGGFDYQPTARVSTIHAERLLAADPLRSVDPSPTRSGSLR